MWVENWNCTPDHQHAPLKHFIDRGNQTFVRKLTAAIENHTELTASLRDAVLVPEIIQGTYASHFAGGKRLPIPLADRRHSLGG